MDKVFIYWDDSNIFISAQQVAIDLNRRLSNQE